MEPWHLDGELNNIVESEYHSSIKTLVWKSGAPIKTGGIYSMKLVEKLK
jgi:hypothetical protein